jgi:hypothetical protein
MKEIEPIDCGNYQTYDCLAKKARLEKEMRQNEQDLYTENRKWDLDSL